MRDPRRPAASLVVAVDGRSLRAGAAARGIARYLESILEQLAVEYPSDRYEVLVPGEPGPAARRVDSHANVVLRGTPVPGRPLFAAAALTGHPRLDRLVSGCDVVWVPAIAPLAVSSGAAYVLTVHDLSFEHRRADFSAYDRAWHRLARPHRLAQRAARLITVSESVRSQVIDEWGIEPGRVVAVPSGPGREPGAPGRSHRAGRAVGYVLAVGALEPRKRPDLLVKAHRRARLAGLEADLVLAGDGPLRDELAAAGATVLGYVPDEELEVLYRDALAVVCASREEGFAFTPLEALARGTPAVVSALPVFSETVGDGALRVAPGDADALADALLLLERDEQLRERLVAAGRRALAKLSWKQSARRTRAVLAAAAAPSS